MVRIALVFFGLLLVQGILSYFQVKNYRNNVAEIRKKGNLFVGQVKGRIKAGSIVLMAIDDSGKIIDGREMTGITVFHRFKPVKNIIGYNIYKSDLWLEKIENSQLKKAIKKGIEVMMDKRQQANEIENSNNEIIAE